jgi:acetyl-CoA C-acetyltransferase
MAPFTEVAAKHPFAWFPEPATGAELAEVTPDNRLTVEPYTKRMNAFMGVDQGAAFVVCSLGLARDLGLAGQAVHVWSVASANDVWFVPERPDLGSSPGIEAAGKGALGAAGVGIDDIGLLDLYSCFPCAVQLGAAALGLDIADRRGLTLTGGLPYFGGPGNNYPSHSLATAVGRLRERGGLALITGLGWYATKHSVAVIGADPPDEGFTLVDTAAAQAAIDATALPVARGEDLGDQAHPMTVEAASVQYGRDGAPEFAVVVGTLADGRRVVARSADTTGLGGEDLVGRRATVAGDPPTFTLS